MTVKLPDNQAESSRYTSTNQGHTAIRHMHIDSSPRPQPQFNLCTSIISKLQGHQDARAHTRARAHAHMHTCTHAHAHTAHAHGTRHTHAQKHRHTLSHMCVHTRTHTHRRARSRTRARASTMIGNGAKGTIEFGTRHDCPQSLVQIVELAVASEDRAL